MLLVYKWILIFFTNFRIFLIKEFLYFESEEREVKEFTERHITRAYK